MLFTIVFALLTFFEKSRPLFDGAGRSPCHRYVNALRNPEIAAELERWYSALPRKIDPVAQKLPPSRFGYGRYDYYLDVNPAKIGLHEKAHAEISVNETTHELRNVVISDARGAMFVFKIGDDTENFKFFTIAEGRTATVGVSCLARD